MTYRNMMFLFVVFFIFSLCEGKAVTQDKLTGGLILQQSRVRRGCGQCHDCSNCSPGTRCTYKDDFFGTCCKCGSSSCFPSSARVSLENGKNVTISELQIGDKVQTVSSEGNVRYSQVTTFMKKHPDEITMYKSIQTSWNGTIKLSGKHLIYSRKRAIDKFIIIYADQLSIGDEVLAYGNSLKSAKVTDISSFPMQGAFTPVTMDGNIMVDGVLASCYAFSDHHMAHLSMTPFQWFPEIMNGIFGVDFDSGYIKLLENVGTWILPKDLMF